jgi:uncharacterized protein involved in exopolysaccharide biosynthesis
MSKRSATSSGFRSNTNAGGAPLYAPSVTPALNPVEQEGLSLERLLKVLRRRRRIFLATMISVTAIGSGMTLYQRAVLPVYQGSFSLLISDPVSATSGGSPGDGAGLAIGEVALNRSRQDVPTLIEVLESPLVLNPVRQRLQELSAEAPLPSFNVSQNRGGGGNAAAPGILDVTLQGRDAALLQQALKITEETYLNWSLQQRRERLQEAVRFLDEQAPELQARASTIRSEVEEFRLKHRLLLPTTDAQATRAQVESYARS